MKVAVLSACYGDYDSVDPVPSQDIDAYWLMVTDNPTLHAVGWDLVVEPRHHMHPRLAAKVPKCNPWLYVDTDVVVWMDASCKLLRPDSLRQIVGASHGHYLAQIVHPWRDDIASEAEASVGMPKYEGQDILGQVNHYRDLGHPLDWGLWATGLAVHNATRSVDMEAFGQKWLAEQVRWTYQDQISQPYVLRKRNLSVKSLPFDLHGSGVFEWRSHTDGT